MFKTSAFEPTEAELGVIQQQIRQLKGTVQESDDDLDEYSLDLTVKLNAKGKGKARAKPESGNGIGDLDLGKLGIDEEKWDPSAKMIKMVSRHQVDVSVFTYIAETSTIKVELLTKWLKETDDQIIIYSQWTSMIDREF